MFNTVINSIKAKISRIIFARAKAAIVINLKSGFSIDSTVKLKGAFIQGKVSIGKHAKIINGVFINARSSVFIDSFTSINGPGTDIICQINSVRIGKFCSIARGVNVQEFNHATDRPTTYYIEQNIFNKPQNTDIQSSGSIEIGNDVWIGAQCVILSGAKIGDGAIIAANSVVNGVIPAYAIAGGSPARIIKYRFEESIVDRLIKLEWWNWSLARIKQNESFFTSPVTHESIDRII